MQFIIGRVLRVSLRNTYTRKMRDGAVVIYYQRPVPKDLLGKYPARLIKHNLGTADPLKAEAAPENRTVG